jgi:nitroreductase
MTETIAPADVLDALRWRYATKVFDPNRKLTPEQVSALEQALVLTPSSFGLQPWRFFVITNRELREKIRPHAWNQPQITDCSHLIVLAARTRVTGSDIDRLIAKMSVLRDVPVESLAGYRSMIDGFATNLSPEAQLQWNQRQVYIALGNLITTAAMLRIDTCPIEGFNPDGVDELLGLPALGYRATVLCAVGFRSEEDKHATLAKVRYSPAKVIEHID